MSHKDKDQDKNNPPNGLSEYDIALWKTMTKDVTRAKGKDYINPSKETKIKPKAAEQKVKPKPRTAPQKPQNAAPKISAQNAQHKSYNFSLTNLDKRTAQRLKKGQIRPEATLDLHGLNQEQAHSAFIHFIQSAARAQKRCILIITGKGTERSAKAGKGYSSAPHQHSAKNLGILKRRLPDWLGTSNIAPHILCYCPAHIKDGGAGAFYIYLRKNNQ